MLLTRYLNPRNDLVFKRIFGTEKNKDILLHFLNDVIAVDGRSKIKQVMLLSTIQNPEAAFGKQSTVDVLCEDEKGTKYIVEMQVAKVRGFEKGAQYYAAKTYINQIAKGGQYEDLKEVVFLAITEYEMFSEKTGYKSEHAILDKKTLENNLKGFSFTFIELPKFTKTDVNDLKTYEEKWCYFFKHADDPENVGEMLLKSDEVIKRAYQELQTHNWTMEELRSYEAYEKISNDNQAAERYRMEEATAKASAEGMAKGEAAGMAKGMAKGMAQGMAKGEAAGMIKGEAAGMAKGMAKGEAAGRAKGENATKMKIAKKMLAQNKTIQEIIDTVELSHKEVEQMSKSLLDA